MPKPATATATTRRAPAGSVLSEAARRVDRLVAELGNNRTAALLDVSSSQPSRWRRGLEEVGSESARRIVDLDYVWTRLSQQFHRKQALIWLESFNHFLGARPVDVLRLRGALSVVPAIDAEEQGAL